MKTSVSALLLSFVLPALGVAACGEEEVTQTLEGPFNISELAGDWRATSAFFVRDSDGHSVDVVADGGSVAMSVDAGGRFTMTIDPADRPAYLVGGEMFWELWEGSRYFSIAWDGHPGDWSSFGATLTSTHLSLMGGFETGEYDFDNDGTPESARIGFEFERA